MKRVERITVSVEIDTTRFDADGVEAIENALGAVNLAAALEHGATKTLQDNDFLRRLVNWDLVQVDVK